MICISVSVQVNADLRRKLIRMKAMHIHVENIKCTGCSQTIQKSLLSQPGVMSVHVNTEGGLVDISGDDTMDREHLVNRLNSLGYPEVGNNNLLKKAMSYVSCAAGRLGGDKED